MGKSTFRTPRRSERRAWRRKRLGLPSYTTAEEIWNAISHGLGAAFAIVALVLLLVNGQHNALTMVSVSIYGSTMFCSIPYLHCIMRWVWGALKRFSGARSLYDLSIDSRNLYPGLLAQYRRGFGMVFIWLCLGGIHIGDCPQCGQYETVPCRFDDLLSRARLVCALFPAPTG